MISFTHTRWCQWPTIILCLVFLTFNSLSGQTVARLDFEAFDGDLTTSAALDALGISFNTPSVNIDPTQFNGQLTPVNVQRRTEAFSGERLAANCTSGIDCEFPDGVVLMEFHTTSSNISFWLRGFDSGRAFRIFTYDEAGNVSLFATERQTLGWQRVAVPTAKGIIIDTDITPGTGGFRTFYLDDVDWSPGVPNRVFDCSTADDYDLRLETEPVFRRNVENLERFTLEYIQNLAEEDVYGFGSEVITIPVVVHVVYNNATENISEAQINSQIDALNELFRATNSGANSVVADFAPLVADLRIQFALAERDPDCEPTSGITRTATTVSSFAGNQTLATPTARNPVKFNSSGGRNGWPSDKYLNLWVCDVTGGTLGYASFPAELSTRPAEDGVVMDYTAFGTTGTVSSTYNLGRVTAHEVGHWLNLRHIWGDDQNADDTCSGSDGVDDTPNQALPNTTCPTSPSVSCTNGPAGDMFMNHMDYTTDVCRTMFTLGQHVRAAATLFGVRASLIGSDGLQPPPATPADPDLWSADTYDDIGDEPNTSTEAMYHSADIWVRNTNDGFVNQEHQNPQYSASDATNYVYVRVRNRGCGGSQSGTTRLYWAKAGSGLSWPSPWDGSIVAPALMGAPLGSQTVTVDGGEFEVLEFEWVVPNPDDYATIPGDKAHFCLLARTETAGGMTFPETGNLYANVQNNNNIVWKNVSVGTEDDGGGFLAQVIVGNFGRSSQFAGLRFNLPGQEVRSIFDYGEVTLELGELFNRWQDNNGQGQGIEPVGGGVVRLLEPGAAIDGIPLEPGELFGVQVRFRPYQNPGINNVFKLDMTQLDLRTETIIGGNQFRFKTLADGIIRPGTGGGAENLPPVFVDCPGEVSQGCTFPVVVRVDMSNVAKPNEFLGNFTAVLRWDPMFMELVDSVRVLSGYTGFTNIDRAAGTVTFNGASVAGQEGDVPILSGLFRAIGPVGATVAADVRLRTLVSAGTFFDLTEDAGVFPCKFEIEPQLLLGDVNGDGLINSTDAAMILAFSVGNPIPPVALQRIQAGVGNVDGNNRTNARDALIILTYDVGLPVGIPFGTATVCPDEESGNNPGGRNSREAVVEVGLEKGEDGKVLIPVTVDLSDGDDRLGSYEMGITWDATKYRFAGFGAGTALGFEQPSSNFSGAAEGYVRLAHANPGGASGRVHLGSLILVPVATTTDGTNPEVRVELSGMAAAGDFTNITPIVRYQEQSLSTDDPLDATLSVFPNPFGGVAYIDLGLPGDTPVKLSVYNLQGQLLTTLLDGKPGAGTHRLIWDARSAAGKALPNGVYLLRAQVGVGTITHRLVLLR